MMRVTSYRLSGLSRRPRFALLVLLLPAGCSRPAASAPEVARPVKTIVVTTGEDTRIRSFPGLVEASKRAELAFQVAGLLVKFPAKEGQRVAKGELIGELRQDEFRARLTALQGQLDQSRATLAALRAGERPEERLRRESQVRGAEARLANARADLDRASRLVQDRAFKNPKIEVIWNTAVEEMVGDPGGLKHLKLRHTVTGTTSDLPVTGAFIFVGFKPNTGLVTQHFEHDASGYMITNDRMETSIPGLFAAGDLRVQLTRQVTTAVGDATTAAIAVEKFLTERKAKAAGVGS